ncbi:MAG: tetratricopeptide repeat protein, partial [Bradymonadaceae bacterium]
MHASDSDEAGGGEELPALEDIRALIEEADGGVDDWVDELDAHAERPDRRRDLEENVWLYRTLGLARRRSDVEESGADAIRRAYELDPTDDESIRVLAETVVDREASEPSQSVEIELLERALALGEHALDRSRRSELAAFLAERLEEQGEAERARSAYLEAADAAESDERAAGMQRAARRTGEDSTDELAARRRAVEELGDPEPRAEALVELAMFWREERDRPRRAIDVLEEARRETPDDPSILEEIAELARALEDWEEFYSAAAAAARHTEGAERVDWLIEAARVAREELRRPERALRGYRRAVELDPARHDAFKQVTAILVELEDWRRLEEAYLDAIELNRESDEARAELIAVLWNNLGDVYRQHLDRPEEALEAYEEALALSPRNLDLREKAAETAREAGAEDAELEHRRVLWRADTERLDDLVRSGELHAGSDR